MHLILLAIILWGTIQRVAPWALAVACVLVPACTVLTVAALGAQ